MNFIITPYAAITAFLSRLCGGEPWMARYDQRAYFLSRLCGGELGFTRPLLRTFFLSRLCGGERFQRCG